MPLIVSYGGGVNSTAMLCGMVELGARPDAILFADTGGEKPETYDYVFKFGAWLLAKGFPAIQVVSNDGMYKTLEQECLTNKTLPSLAYGWKKYSQKYKHRPQHKWAKGWGPAVRCWDDGGRVVKALGIAYHEKHRANVVMDDFYMYTYPLINWCWDQRECLDAIDRAGLDVPVKSACFFCPASKKKEVVALAENHPELLARAVAMEHNAAGNHTVNGLGRHWTFEEVAAAGRKALPMFDAGGPECMCVGEVSYDDDEPSTLGMGIDSED